MRDHTENQADFEADLSPEARRERALRDGAKAREQGPVHAGPGARALVVLRRVLTGILRDGFIHAGNLAYMALVSLFPFFIAVAAIFTVIGEPSQRAASIDAFLASVPPSVRQAIGPVAHNVVNARQGWLLWVGGLFGLWTASSLIETIRDILHRAYGVPGARAFWEYRLFSIGLIFVAVFLLLVSLSAQVVLSALQELLFAWFPELGSWVGAFIFSRVVGGLVLFGSMYLLFVTLTPRTYQGRQYAKWPGAAFVAAWWMLLTISLPLILRTFFTYDLTYGSLAGVMIALFFFWLVGLGLVFGAELNAALAVTPEERKAGERGDD